jgi:cation transport protein ChaC
LDYARATDEILASHSSGKFWVFAYGSLLWKPGFDFTASFPAHANGWHRAFCLEILRWRGSPEQPGLMLALDHGGSCKGMVFELPVDQYPEQVGRLLRREVPYHRQASPFRWIKVWVDDKQSKALTFYAGMHGDSFYTDLPIEIQARMLARAVGHGGTGTSYLHQTISKLDELGIHDTYLWRLEKLVAAEIRQMHPHL